MSRDGLAAARSRLERLASHPEDVGDRTEASGASVVVELIVDLEGRLAAPVRRRRRGLS
jgi:hypothetical protein